MIRRLINKKEKGSWGSLVGDFQVEGFEGGEELLGYLEEKLGQKSSAKEAAEASLETIGTEKLGDQAMVKAVKVWWIR